MPYITREDGERFVIPSYRDVLAVTHKSQLKKDILALSQNYGAYIAMQAKGTTQYEVAFSPDPGYLLGESIWHHFNRPMDLIYCEAVPNSTEAILVIVKSGAVYLDGRFPVESIPEELIIFLTQQNNFEIYTYGDVPITETPEPGKFSFENSSVKSFTQLDHPVFATLALLKAYQLQLVEPVLKAHGIGVFPLKPLLVILAIGVVSWLLWSYLSYESAEVVPQQEQQVDVYQGFNTALMSPAPDQEIKLILTKLRLLTTMPGWTAADINYSPGQMTVKVLPGDTIASLSAWAEKNEANIEVQTQGVFINIPLLSPNRPKPQKIYPMRVVIADLIDRISKVYPGNHVQLNELNRVGIYSSVKVTIQLEEVTPVVLSLIGEQLKDMPIVLTQMKITNDNGQLTGTLILEGLGS